MQFCFIANGDVLTLPITPASYEWTTGKNIETINISQLGRRVPPRQPQPAQRHDRMSAALAGLSVQPAWDDP